LQLGVIFALSGMLVTLFGAEQIVGTMVAKAITGSLFYNGAASTSAAAAGMQLRKFLAFIFLASTIRPCFVSVIDKSLFEILLGSTISRTKSRDVSNR
jgi:hypothetical protein